MKLGFDAQAARQLAAQHDEPAIQAALKKYRTRKAKSGRTIANPLGYLRRLLEVGEEQAGGQRKAVK